MAAATKPAREIGAQRRMAFKLARTLLQRPARGRKSRRMRGGWLISVSSCPK